MNMKASYIFFLLALLFSCKNSINEESRRAAKLTHQIQEETYTSTDNTSRFSQKLGYTHPTKVYNILNGKNFPSFEILQDILKNFKQVNIEWILLGEGDMLLSKDSPTDIQAVIEENKQLKTKV